MHVTGSLDVYQVGAFESCQAPSPTLESLNPDSCTPSRCHWGHCSCTFRHACVAALVVHAQVLQWATAARAGAGRVVPPCRSLAFNEMLLLSLRASIRTSTPAPPTRARPQGFELRSSHCTSTNTAGPRALWLATDLAWGGDRAVVGQGDSRDVCGQRLRRQQPREAPAGAVTVRWSP